MAFFLSPGVFTREVDLSAIIPNVATSIGAIVGASARGPIDTPTLVTNSQQFLDQFGNPDPQVGFMHYAALSFLNESQQLYVVRVRNGATHGAIIVNDEPAATDTAAAPSGGYDIIPNDVDFSGFPDSLFAVTGINPGTWNNNLKITITNIDAVEFEFDLTVYEERDGTNFVVEVWNVSRKTKLDGFGRQLNITEKINGQSKFIQVVDDITQVDTVLPPEITTPVALTEGVDSIAVTDGQVVLGWDLFINPDVVDVRILINGGLSSQAVQAKMVAICESRKDCIAVLDVPSASQATATDVVTWRNGDGNFNTSYAAAYTPDVEIFDEFNDLILEVPPSGHIAATYARTDFVAETWFAPAGLRRGILNVRRLAVDYTQGERDTTYPAGVNSIRNFPGQGIAVWGQRTMQARASALDRVNVRRLLIVIEKAISQALLSSVFELNNDFTRLQIRQEIDTFMRRVQARDGVFDFRTVVDETNNTPAVIDANQLNVDLFLKPQRAAEFIQLTAIITKTGADFDELIGAGALSG